VVGGEKEVLEKVEKKDDEAGEGRGSLSQTNHQLTSSCDLPSTLQPPFSH